MCPINIIMEIYMQVLQKMLNFNNYLWTYIDATSLWGKCEVATHTPENGTSESFETPKNSEHDCRGQNSLHWGVLYIVGKGLEV
jgi:hypothetical protein